MRLIKIIISFFLVLVLSTSCQSLKRTLSLQKKESVDEFLIQKKNPLTLPPEFSELPKPKDELNAEELEDENLDLTEVLGKSESKDVSDSTSEIEKSISNILKKK